MDERAQEVLEFWFVQTDKAKWFNGGEEFDQEVKRLFVDLISSAANGELAAWKDKPKSALAYIILIDQFSRNIFRNQPYMFAHDDLALSCCKSGIQKGFVDKLTGAERLFFIMPLIHSENLTDQELGIASLDHYYRQEDGYEDSKKFYERHREIIQRFGRFPHRNKILGRASTPEEETFLEEPFSSF